MKFQNIKIDDIKAKDNVRQDVEEESLRELMSSIKQYGVLQPLLVRVKNDKYDLVAGFRRLMSAKKLGLQIVPCVVQSVSDDDRTSIQLVENIQREDLNPIDEALAVSNLIAKHKLEDVALMIGKTKQYIEIRQKLLSLPKEIQDGLREKKIAVGHGIVISRLVSPKIQKALYKEILMDRMSVKQAENRLGDFGKRLSNTPFNTENCVNCEHSGNNQADLFDKDLSLEGECLNAVCYIDKVKDYYRTQKKFYKEKGIQIIPEKEYREDTRSKWKKLSSYEVGEMITEDWKKEQESGENLAVIFPESTDQYSFGQKEEMLINSKVFQRLSKRKKALSRQSSGVGKVSESGEKALKREREISKQRIRVDDTKRRFLIAELEKNIKPYQANRIVLELLMGTEGGSQRTVSKFLINAGIMKKEKVNYEIRHNLPNLLSQCDDKDVLIEAIEIAKRNISNHSTEELELFADEIKVSMKQFKVDEEYLNKMTKDTLVKFCKEFKLQVDEKFISKPKSEMVAWILKQKISVPKELLK